MTYTATYSPDDNKIRLYASSRLPADEYTRVKAAGFRWAPKQDLFFATWTPQAEDLALELTGEIGDEDKSLFDRAEERADRFEDYRDKRTADANQAHQTVKQIADGIPLGQPILVGHHSERHARKDAERIENGMRKAVKLWETAEYWKDRARGAIRHAKYKELPSVRARRIKTLEADQRKQERTKAEHEKFLKAWSLESLTPELALKIANYDHLHLPRKEGDRPDFNQQPSAYDALTNNYPTLYAPRTLDEVVAAAKEAHPKVIARAQRWITHYENRLAYDRAMLNDAGGTVADKTGPEKGGACKCWASPGFGKGWSYIQKVNKVSVTVHDDHGNGGRTFRRNIEFDKLTAVMTKAEVDTARADGRLRETQNGLGFFLLDAPPTDDASLAPKDEPPARVCVFITPREIGDAVYNEQLNQGKEIPDAWDAAAAAERQAIESLAPKDEPAESVAGPEPTDFVAMRETLRAGVKVVVAPQLFPTPPDLAQRLIAAADIQPGHRVLEPSAGNGALVAAIWQAEPTAHIHAVEINQDVALVLANRWGGKANFDVHPHDFLACVPGCFADAFIFDRIVTNPPFADGQDVRHVTHALSFLKPSGRLVAIMSAGITFRMDKAHKDFRGLLNEFGATIEQLPADSFKSSGTSVQTVMVTIEGCKPSLRTPAACDSSLKLLTVRSAHRILHKPGSQADLFA